MAGTGVTEFVHTINDSIERRVVTDGGVRAPEVVVNRTGDADNRDIILLREQASASKRAITADDDQGINLLFLNGIVGTLTPFGSLELLAASGFENRTSALDNTAHILGSKLLYFVVHEAFVAAENSFDADVVSDSSAGDGAHCCIHSRSITA